MASEVTAGISEQDLLATTGILQAGILLVEARRVELARTLLSLRKRKFANRSGSRVLAELAEQHGMTRQDTAHYLRIAECFLDRADIPVDKLSRLGIARAALIRTAALTLLEEMGSPAVQLLVDHALCHEVAELKQRCVIAGLLDDVRQGIPAPHRENFGSQGIASNANQAGSEPNVDPNAEAENEPEAELDPEAVRQEHRQVIGQLLFQILRGPKTRMPPAPSDFKVRVSVWRQMCLSIQSHRNLLLIGPAGSGKTELVQRLASGTERPLEIFSFGAMSEPRTSMIGTSHFSPRTGTFFRESRFVRAISTPNCVVLLDELNRCDPSAYNLLIPLLDGQRYLSLDEHPDSPVCRVAPGVSFVATANVGTEYAGTKSIDKAIKDRFSTVIQVTFPSESTKRPCWSNAIAGCRSNRPRCWPTWRHGSAAWRAKANSNG